MTKAAARKLYAAYSLREYAMTFIWQHGASVDPALFLAAWAESRPDEWLAVGRVKNIEAIASKALKEADALIGAQCLLSVGGKLG